MSTGCHISAWRRTATALLLLLCLPLLPATSADAQGAPMTGFAPIGVYVLEIDDQAADGTIYASQQARALVIKSPALSDPLLINLATGSVSGVQLMKIVEHDNGSLDLLPNPTSTPYGPYAVDGPALRFEVDGMKVAVMPKPVLTGNRSPVELVDHDPSYGTKRDAYSPAADLIAKLEAQGDEVRVRIYFGTWCPFCGEMVPRVLKIDEQLAGSNITFEYYGLPRSINEDAEARAMAITGVPTGVVYVGGKEAGRISGNGWRTPEQALLDLID